MTLQSFLQKLRCLSPHKVYQFLKDRIWSTDSILLLIRPAGRSLETVPQRSFPGTLLTVTETQLSDCAAFEDAARYVPIYRNMLRRGDIVQFGYWEGRCVFRHCLMLSGSFFFGNHAVRTLKGNEVYIHYAFCAPQARGNHFHTESIRRFCSLYPDHTVYTMVKKEKLLSLRGYIRNGLIPHSRITVKNRFFCSTLYEIPLSAQEVAAIEHAALGQN